MADSLFLATPCYGGNVHIHFMRSVLDLQAACAARGVELHVELRGGDALIPRARAVLAAQFLASKASHLLFVDADIGFRPEHVFRLLQAQRQVVGGVYPLKQIDWDKARKAAQAGLADLQAASVGYVVRFLPSPTNSVEVDDDGFGAVAYVGAGFLLLRRDAVQAVWDAHPELEAKMGDITGPGGGAADLRHLCRAGHPGAAVRGLCLPAPLARHRRPGVRRFPDPARPCGTHRLCRQSDGRPAALSRTGLPKTSMFP